MVDNVVIGSDSRNFTMDHATYCDVCGKEVWIHGQPKVLKEIGFQIACRADGPKQPKG
jgi:hypothetical protein